MGGGVKALLDLGGKPMIGHVIGRLEPQVDRLYLSVESLSPEFEALGLEQLPDPRPGSNGPLGGLAACLRRATADGCRWLLLAPCDAPFLPGNLGLRLVEQAKTCGTGIAVVRSCGHLQPTFSLWHREVLAEVERAAILEGTAGFRRFLSGHPHSILDWPDSPADPFFNVNDRAALAEAIKMMARLEEA